MTMTLPPRPRPPADLVAIGAAERFVPSLELQDWVQQHYIMADGKLHFAGHKHLDAAHIGFLWTNAANSRHMRRIVGQAELVESMGGKSGAWQRARAEQQVVEWFGSKPDFIITLDALYCDSAEDLAFCALVDHELCHCAQALNEFDMPKFSKDTGLPKFAMRGHDVEEFVSVVARFGIEAAGDRAVDFVVAAAGRPAIGPAKLAQACGTCIRMVA